MLDLWPLKYPCANISPNLFLQKCKQQHLDKLKEVKTPRVLVGASNGDHSVITNSFQQVSMVFSLHLGYLSTAACISEKNKVGSMLAQWFLGVKSQAKITKCYFLWVGASNSGHSMIAYLLPQLTKSNILWFMLDLWPLKIPVPTWTQIYFFKNASNSTEVN